MKNADLERVVDLFLKATPGIVVGARGFDGSCKFCGSPRGVQHDPSCPTWGLINARIEHHLLAEGLAKPNDSDPEFIMKTLETGTHFAPVEPSLALNQGAASARRLPL